MKSLFIALCLCLLTLAGCNTSATKPGAGADSTGHAASSAIAYIDFDTLLAHYDMYTDLRAEFEAKATKADADLSAKGRSLERDAADLQNKMQRGLITSANAQTTAQSLQSREQSLLQQQQSAMNALAEEEQVMGNRIRYAIQQYLKEFNADKRYGVILTTTASGPILDADPALDITSAVLKGLNKQYAATKDKPAAEPTPDAQ